MKRTLLFILLFLPMLPLEVKAQFEVFDDILYYFDDYTLTARVEGSENKEINGNIDIPDSITYKGYVYNVTSIASYAFRNCTKITSINIPDSLSSIGGKAFYGCTGLTSITIPIGVKGIGADAFSGCTNLTSIEVAEDNPVFDSRENCNAIIQTASNTLIFGCQNSTIPNSVTTIGNYAFGNCIGLTSITIPNSVISIDCAAFQGCSNLSSVIIGEYVESIGKSAFEYCSSLTSVVIPNNVKTMGEYAFRECSSLSSVIIGDGVKNIERLTFLFCTNLSTVTIGNSVESIKEGAFDHCSNLTSINIPNNVTTIGREVFQECSNLSSVVIGNSVTSIGEQAFRLCSKLDNFYSYAEQVPECHWSSFSGSNYKATLHVSAASVSAYQAVEPWKNFKEIVALTDQEEGTDDSDYIPFVELGKQWHVVSNPSYPYSPSRFERYDMFAEVERDGKTYVHIGLIDDGVDIDEIKDAGLIREENRRVYMYDEAEGRELMRYDFSLKEGDTFTYEYDLGQLVNCKVLKQGWLEDGPKIAMPSTTPADTLDIKYRRLRTWTIGREYGSGEYYEMATWVEGVGTLINMFDLYPLVGGMSCLAYIERKYVETDYNLNSYLPFSFNNMYGPTHGCDLPTGAENNEEDEWSQHHLTYEQEGNRLHVYGDVFTQCGPNNYAYFIEKTTDDPMVHKIEFKIQEVEPLMDCMALHATDFYVSGFDPNLNYFIVDNQGAEHPVVNKTPQNEYRPFVEEGKVWVVSGSGISSDGQSILHWTDYCYFEGDTIVGGQTCKLMKCVGNANGLIGAWYEQDKKVYYARYGNLPFELLYDFTLSSNDTIASFWYPLVVKKESGGIPGFKGTYYELWHENQLMHRWLEGVGSESWPYYNQPWMVDGGQGVLLACYVDDEVIYYNSEVEDPYDLGAMKRRFDFTHTTKLQPKAPMRRDAEPSLYGEYNNLLLDINLDPLSEAYLVRITDETGNVVYEKAINAGNIVALNIDISAYAKGRYVVTVENSSEAFTGEFEVQTTGIEEISSKRSEVRDYIYNLQGQRLSTLQKGLNIVNGKKVFVKSK